MTSLKEIKTAFVKNQEGTVTVEFVIWFPLLFLFMMFFLLFAWELARQSLVINHLHQVARAYSAGYFLDEAAAETYTTDYVKRISSRPEDPGLSVDVADEFGFVTINVEFPIMDPLNFFSFRDYKFGAQTISLAVRSPIEGRP